MNAASLASSACPSPSYLAAIVSVPDSAATAGLLAIVLILLVAYLRFGRPKR